MITWRPAALVAAGAVVTASLGAAVDGAAPGDGGVWPWVGCGLVLAATGVLIMVDYLLTPSPGTLRLSREGDRTVWLGGTATVHLIARNTSPRRMSATVRDIWVPSAGARSTPTRIRVGPGHSARITTTLRPTRRGDRPAVRVVVRCHGPMRLAYRQTTRRASRALTPPWVLRVHPRFTSLRLLPEKVSRLRVLDGELAVRGRGRGTEFDSLREYVPGDDVRSIDWRASARQSTVMVRNWRPERDRRVLCVLDTGRTSAVRIADEPRLDTAIDAALLLATLAARANDKVDLLAVDTQVRAQMTAGRQTMLSRMVSTLGPVSPALAETDFGLVVSEVLRVARKRALVVIFTALEPGSIGEGLLPVLPNLTARHTVLVAACHDPGLLQMGAWGLGEVTAGSGVWPEPTPAEVYLAASAQRALTERGRVRAVLRRAGVEVVDAPADQLASEVADAYLALKGTGRL